MNLNFKHDIFYTLDKQKEYIMTLFAPIGQRDSLETRNALIIAARDALRGTKTVDELTPVAPMAVERLITAQMNHYANNDQNVRARTLFHATPIGIGWLLTLGARIIRVLVRTIGIFISAPVAAFQHSRYSEYMTKDENGEPIFNLVVEDLRRIGQEWIDLGATFLAAGIGTINTVAPTAISTEFLFNYYTERNTTNVERNTIFRNAQTAYTLAAEDKHTAWKNAERKAG